MGNRGTSRALLCFALGAALGCVPLSAGSGIGPVEPAAVSAPIGAWFAPAIVGDPRSHDSLELQRGLTLAIASHALHSKYFPRVNLLPGNPRPDEVVLRFHFERYRFERTAHPFSMVGAMLTGSLYAFLGLPVSRDRAHISGELVVEDASGKEIVRLSEALSEVFDHSIYDVESGFASSLVTRTRVVRTLLDEAVRELAAVRALAAR